ncbi:metallophosphoesterase [Planctomycetota bacterium]
MSIYAISDLHLPGGTKKKMDIFGKEWKNHQDTIARSWDETVGGDDIVLIPGDFSWAMRLEDTRDDFTWLKQRPGSKVMIRGNHDFWWDSVTKVREVVPECTFVIQNDSLVLDDIGFGGTRFWDDPDVSWPLANTKSKEAEAVVGDEELSTEEGEKLIDRELQRLRMSLELLPDDLSFRIALLHFPPIGLKGKSRAAHILKEYNIDVCVFGHVHSVDRSKVKKDTFKRSGVTYYPVSADFLGFSLQKIKTK